jgi:purine-binding chemotaxis protein CheW
MPSTEVRTSPRAGAPGDEYLVFVLENVRCAVRSEAVRRVLPAARIDRLPRLPGVVEGVVDVAGEVVPVVDLRGRFGLAPKPVAYTDHFIVTTSRRRSVVLRVDRALDVVRIDPAEVEAAESVVSAAGLLAGVARTPDGLLMIGDVEALLEQAEADEIAAALGDSRTTP